ncbi:hypothetical protein M422DRAFT_48477 [Sphaerobolus stellatus SS14]|uniref:Uncharacterized protein n=1 Tax=Sphaerobolus stellatus (strain SS14) TaxID=990650 RepID=A0A0C9UFI1_SPHS4|nr:hypothetical protein M422DRAFT_48477 [Sphaerobolus stellatus SS14]
MTGVSLAQFDPVKSNTREGLAAKEELYGASSRVAVPILIPWSETPGNLRVGDYDGTSSTQLLPDFMAIHYDAWTDRQRGIREEIFTNLLIQIPAIVLEALDSITGKETSQVTYEGGVAISEKLMCATGVTYSGDGTTHKNINIKARHAYAIKGEDRYRLFLGVESTASHSSEAQVAGFKHCVADICATWMTSPRGISQIMLQI